MGGLRSSCRSPRPPSSSAGSPSPACSPFAGFWSKDEILLYAFDNKALWAGRPRHRPAHRLLHEPARCSWSSSAAARWHERATPSRPDAPRGHDDHGRAARVAVDHDAAAAGWSPLPWASCRCRVRLAVQPLDFPGSSSRRSTGPFGGVPRRSSVSTRARRGHHRGRRVPRSPHRAWLRGRPGAAASASGPVALPHAWYFDAAISAWSTARSAGRIAADVDRRGHRRGRQRRRPLVRPAAPASGSSRPATSATTPSASPSAPCCSSAGSSSRGRALTMTPPSRPDDAHRAAGGRRPARGVPPPGRSGRAWGSARTSVATGVLSVYVLVDFDRGTERLPVRLDATSGSRPSASLDLGVDGISLFLVVLTGVLFPIALVGVKPHHGRRPTPPGCCCSRPAASGCSSPSTSSCSSSCSRSCSSRCTSSSAAGATRAASTPRSSSSSTR